MVKGGLGNDLGCASLNSRKSMKDKGSEIIKDVSPKRKGCGSWPKGDMAIILKISSNIKKRGRKWGPSPKRHSMKTRSSTVWDSMPWSVEEELVKGIEAIARRVDEDEGG
ncbi:hypothetical protein LWI28_013958 [Acer negundo]|uniref:Uncharacterized protein n=1 Tax=Acer negundo TaxID=4023 RepID=A0AAD5IE24_ACENE|nr:hypothetical protein LWI28_013958 [Acer negundo]